MAAAGSAAGIRPQEAASLGPKAPGVSVEEEGDLVALAQLHPVLHIAGVHVHMALVLQGCGVINAAKSHDPAVVAEHHKHLAVAGAGPSTARRRLQRHLDLLLLQLLTKVAVLRGWPLLLLLLPSLVHRSEALGRTLRGSLSAPDNVCP